MLLAISTTRGIQAESDENASGSSAAPPNDGVSTGRPRRRRARRRPAAAAAAAEPEVERAFLLGQDPDREVEPADRASSRASPRMSPQLARMKRSWPASDVGARRAGSRMSSSSDGPSPSIGGPSAKVASRPAIASR